MEFDDVFKVIEKEIDLNSNEIIEKMIKSEVSKKTHDEDLNFRLKCLIAYFISNNYIKYSFHNDEGLKVYFQFQSRDLSVEKDGTISIVKTCFDEDNDDFEIKDEKNEIKS